MLPTNTVAATDLKYDGSPTGNIYRYDQVGRLRTDEFVSAVPQTGSYSWQVNTLKEYNSSYVYDENGNLQALNRNGYPLPGDVVNMDRITYNYGAGVTQGNRLQSVSDGGTMDYPAAPAVRDIRGTQATNNYQYDAQGRLKQDLQESLEYVWLPNGKIGEVKKNGVVKVRFLYDAEGNRVRKTEYNPNGSVAGSTYYVYGEDGSVAAVYRQQGTGDVYLSEVPLYGAGRLGMMTFPADASTRHCPTCVQSEDFAAGVKATRRVGAKLYELTDHLGNVRAVVGDVKLPDGGTFKVDLKSYTNYYPYGMAQPKREWGANYRYGYNGVEEDDELKGDKNSLSTYYRLYDPRLALWLGIDPVVHESESPYAAMGGNPILYADPSGAEGEIQEFTSDISDPNKNKDLNGLANGTTVKYNGRDIYKDEGKWAWTVNVKSVAEVTGERSGKTQTVTDNQPHSEGESGFMGSAYYHAGRWYDENAYRDLMWSAVRIARNHPSAQGMKLSDIGFTPQSLLDPNNSSNHFEFLGQADRELFGTNERVAFGDGSNPYLGELYAPSNTGMDGTGLMAVWGWGGLGRSLARGLSRSLIGAISKKAVALEVAETLAPEAGMGVTNAGEMLGNFGIPKLYTYTNGGKSVFVTPHAMKHLEELAANGAKLGSDYLNLLGQIHQKALHSAIDDVLSRGAIQFRKMYYSGGNEIMFGAPRTAGELPAVIHFR